MTPDEVTETPGETPTIEVRVYRDAVLVHQELCESEEQAALVVDEWAELDGIECEVDDLSTHNRPGDIFEPEPAVQGDEDYPGRLEIERSAQVD